MEAQQEAFHRKVNEGYLTLTQRYPDRIVLIDGARSVQDVHQDIWDRTQKMLAERDS